MPDDSELVAAKDRAAEQLLRLPGVTGVGIGGRERAGRPTGEIVLKVFVRTKRAREELDPAAAVPERVAGLPTDVVEMGDAEPDAAPAPPTGAFAENPDRERYRPLVGGTQLQPDLSGPRSGPGTLGCFLVDPADASKVYALTNWHVLDARNEHPVLGTTKAGQPTKKDSATKCCSAIIGKVAGGGKDPLRDAGIVRLDPGTEWRADILEIGAVKGTHTITLAEAATLKYAVRKRGIKTRLTGGTVQAINATVPIGGITHTNLTVVAPNPNPAAPAGRRVVFSMPGDSGAAVVNAANEVVALHFGRAPAGAHSGRSVSTPIAAVLSRFQAVEGLTLQVATASNPGVTNTVPGAALVTVPPEVVSSLPGDARVATGTGRVALPVGAWLPGLVPPGAPALSALQRDLDRSYAGRSLVSLWLDHQDELTGLLDGNRRVATTWHRSGAAAVLQLLARMVGDPTVTLPVTVHGRPVATVVDRVRDAFARYGSAELRRDVERVRTLLPDLAGLTYPQIVDALDTV